MSRLVVRTSWGEIQVDADHGAVRSCRLPLLGSVPGKPFTWRGAKIEADTSADRCVLRAAERFLRKVFRGEPARRPPVHWPKGTPFEHRVWRSLLALKSGECVAYGELAARVECPRGARAVGRACKANPLPLFIPCHRVVPKSGTSGGFSSGWPWKRLLLERERKWGRAYTLEE